MNKPVKVFITVDVEDPYNPNEMYRIWGDMQGERYGVPTIIEILNRYGLKGVFFVDVYEHAIHTKTRMRGLLEYIAAQDHEVQLHTHPGVDTEKFGKGGMARRDPDQQTRILECGMQFIRDTLGTVPVAHRAGGYKADLNTLKALRRVGISVDSSLFYKASGCLIDTKGNRFNSPVIIEDILEVPITTVDVRSPIFSANMKLDIEQDLLVLTRGLEAVRKAGATAIVIFLHSWSFLPVYSTRRSPRKANISKFDALCRYLWSHRTEYSVAGFEQWAADRLVLSEGCTLSSFPRVDLSLAESFRPLRKKLREKVEYRFNAKRINSAKARFDF